MKKFLVSFISLSCLFWLQVQAQAVSFTATEWATAQSLSTGDAVSSYTASPITVSFAHGIGSAVTYNGKAIAAGEGNTLTITAATGYQLTAMSFTQNVAAQATRLAGNSWSAGSASVNAENSKQVDWTGAAGQVSVSFTGNQVFTAFSVTYEDMNKSFTVTFVGADGTVLKTESVLYGNAATPPTPPTIAGKVFKDWDKDYTNITGDMTITAVYDFDPAVMNDTVEMWAKDIMDYNELTAGEKFENIDYQKDGKTIIVDKGTATSNSNYPYYYYDSWNYAYGLVVQSGNKITFKAPFKIHKILIHHYIKNYFDGYPDCADCNPPTTNTGALSFEDVYITWEGSSSLVEINFTEYTQILDFTIIGDKNDDKSTVRFFNFDGKLLDTKTVKDGSNITAPAYSNPCFAGWDKSLSGIYEDLDVHPVREKLLDLTATAWRDSEKGSKRITMGDFTLIPTNRWNDEEAEFGDTNMGNWVYIPHLALCTNKPLTIVGKDWFQNLTMICPDGQAAKLAAATFSSGTAKQTGNNVLWSGDTDSLVITPTQDCNIFEFVIYCQEHETPSFTVVFLDENDNELKRETVARGNSVTPPAYSAPDDCHIFLGWDKDLSRVRGDMTVRPMLETKVIQSLSAIGWARLQNDSSSNAAMQNVETNGYAFSAPNSILIETEQRINGKRVTSYYIRIRRGGTISIASDNYVRNITFTVLNEHDAENLAAATYSQGKATRDSIRVTWQGATDKLDITLPTNDNIGLTLIEINCEIITDHTVTFLDRDGKVIDTKVVPDGSSVTPPADPAPENECYLFKGWSEQLTNIHTDLTVKPVFEFINDCIPAGFVRVTFVDFAGDTLTLSFVEIGGTAVAPEAPELKYHKFTGWSHPLSNITETVTIKPTYSFDLGSKDILTVQQAYDLITKDYSEYDKVKDSPYEYYHDWNDFALKDMYAVRGIVCVYPNNGNRVTLSDGRLSFNVADVMIENGETNGNTLISGYSMLNPDMEPFISNLQLQNGDTVIMYGQLGRFRETFGYGDYYDYLGIGNGYIPYIGKYTSDEGIVYLDMPDAAAMYDFSGNSLKQLLQHNSKCNYSNYQNICSETLAQTGDFTDNFAFDKTVYSADEGGIDGDIKFVTGISDDQYAVTLVSSGSYAKTIFSDNTSVDGTVVLPNMDFNGDGRLDYFVVNKLNFINTAPVFGGLSISEGHAPRRPYRAPSKAAATPQYEHYVAYTQPDGSLKLEYIYAMSWDEYQAQMSDTEWAATAKELTYSSGRGLITPNYGYSAGMASLSGVAFSDHTSDPLGAKVSSPAADTPNKAPSIGYTVPFITKALDLNADNLTDLIDEKNGIIYLNMGGGQFVLTETNGMVVPADLNNDGLMDFIFPGEKLYTSIYKGEGKFDTKTIYENAAVDDLLYCYDFDHDGDIDILATFSAQANATKTAYTCFFLNDGNGNFTQQPEQNYGTDNLWFSALQDIDGDGYFDLLAFRADILSNYEINNTSETPAEIVWLRGSQNNRFASPSVLYNLTYQNSGWGAPAMNVSKCRINAEDLDGDGKAEIWVSGLSQGKTQIFTTEFGDAKTFSVTANTAPVAPAAPELRYDNGILTVTWGNGQDKETMVGDLSYALRLGTKPGSNDILRAAANADGSRRNFLDGNMGNRHSYTIDLSTYPPSKIYASVQAIDAQHKGSAWSEEASIDHTALPAQFTMSSDRIAFNEMVKIHYTQLPKGYSHTWLYADGELRREGSFIKLSFPTAGEKIITHTVTAPDGKAASFTATLTVLPAGMSTYTLTFGDDYDTNKTLFTEAVKADFNNDGLLDAYYNKYISQATSLTTYTQATGLWNTNIQGTNNNALWFDWNKNGYADLLTASGETGYYLPHADNQPDMTAQQQDDNISLYFANNVYRLGADLLHDGYPTAYSQGYLIQQHAGSEYGYTEVSLKNGDNDLLKNALEGAANNYYTGLVNNFIIDYDRDGYFDIAYLRDEYIDNVNQYRKLLIFLNRGNAEFEQTEIPFTQSIASGDFRYPQLADLNNDGYIDILATRDFWTESSDGSIYILWNNQNQSLSAPDILPLGNLQSFDVNGYNGNQLLIDINNDGYLDIISRQKNSAAGNDINGIYVWYMGPQGVLTQGFLIPQTNMYNLSYINTMIPNEVLVDNQKVVQFQSAYEREIPVELSVVSINANNAPAAPQGVRAVQTSDGLLIEWNPAEDDHTPAVQMRYNLSVKHAGRSGSGSFVISPQNGLNSKTAYLPAHKYLSATRFLVPLSELTAGDYEVQVQAIDQRNLMSDFSDVVTVNIDRQIIDAPTTVCTYDEVTVTYMSEDRTGTPVWDFDGGTIISGTGFGPYRVSWEDEGTKTITLTIGDKTYTRMLYADQVSGSADLPAALFDGGSVDVSWSDNLYGELEISINGTVQSVTEKGIDGRDPQLTFSGHTLQLDTRRAWSKENALTNFSSLELILTLTNANGCAGELRKSVEIISLDNLPQIALVTSDADGHNIISWNADADLFPQIQVLKETNIRDQFVELGVVSTIDGRFTDLSSDASQRAERYAIRGIMNGGTRTPASPVHQTVHTTINRGATDNQWNLIWNQYVGADVVSYNILRGQKTDNNNTNNTSIEFTQIASVSSYNTSYTDYAPQDAQPYYAIEYVLADSRRDEAPTRLTPDDENPTRRDEASTRLTPDDENPTRRDEASTRLTSDDENPTRRDEASTRLTSDNENPSDMRRVAASSLQGRSNIVNRVAAKTMTYAQTLTILSANGKYETTADNLMLLLYAEVMPSNTTYKQVVWEITEGATLATIDQSSGLITARTPNDGGTITVKATAVDGSGVTATRQIRIAAIKDNTPVEPTYFTVTFYSWDGTVITTQTVEQGKSATAPQAPQRDGYTFVGWDKAFTNVQSDLSVTAQYHKNGTPVDYTPKNLRTEQDGNFVYFLWDAVQGATEYEFVLTQGENIIYSAAIDHNGAELDFSSQQPGNYSVEWKVRTTLPEVSDWATATYTIVVTDIDEVEVQKQWSPRKVIEDGHVYIILPDGKRYDAVGRRTK